MARGYSNAGVALDSTLDLNSQNGVKNSVITTAINLKANSADLAAVATSGDYEDLTNKPNIEQTYFPNSSSSSAISLGALVNAKMLQNLGTGQFSLAVGDYRNTEATGEGGVAIGISASANNAESTAIGHVATANGGTQGYAIAIGAGANASENNAIQLGAGTNSTPDTMQVWTYTLLNKNTGKIPSDRLNLDLEPIQNSTNPITSGAVYAALGNIEATLDAIIAQGSNS